jgi:uncharacterized membrane protein YeaQ/YmgE (transglycosylase-associated protein family)
MIEPLIWLVVVGGIAGWLASLLMGTGRRTGLIGYVIIGILGSLLGSAVFQAVGFAAVGLLARLIVGVVGAVLLIAILKGLKIYR